MNLFDMVQQGDNGMAFAELARRFGLSEDQVNAAVEAMMPAFSTALKRNTAAADGMAEFLRALSGGSHAAYYRDAARAFSDAGLADGNAVLGHLFGSKEVSRMVAAQAEAATGIGQDILKQMLPALADMVMGGLSKQAGDPAGSPFGRLMEQFAGSLAEPPPAGEGPLDRYERDQVSKNPFADMLEQFMAAGAAGNHPLGQIFEQFAGGGSGHVGQEVFGELLDSGQRMSEEYQKSMKSIFDSYLKETNGR